MNVVWDDGVIFIFTMTDLNGNQVQGGFYHNQFLTGQLEAASGGAQKITESGPATSSVVETIKYTSRRQPSATSSVTAVTYDDDPAKVIVFYPAQYPGNSFGAQPIYSVAG
jgi:hypothetical protein